MICDFSRSVILAEGAKPLQQILIIGLYIPTLIVPMKWRPNTIFLIVLVGRVSSLSHSHLCGYTIKLWYVSQNPRLMQEHKCIGRQGNVDLSSSFFFQIYGK